MIEGKEDSSTLIDEVVEDCYSCLFMKSTELKASQGRKHQVARRAHPSELPKEWMKKRAVKWGQSLRFQQLFYLDRGKLAHIILDDVQSLRCGIPVDEMHKVFRSRWESPGTFKGLGAFRTIGQADNSAFEAIITVKEISKCIKEISKNTAPGPDGLSLRDLIKIDPHYTQLTELFNPWLISDTILDMVKECWSVLISIFALPECQNDINNW